MKGNYTEEVINDEFLDLMTVDDFRQAVEIGCGFTDWDGFGHPVKEMKEDTSIYVYPSKLDSIPEDATHIN